MCSLKDEIDDCVKHSSSYEIFKDVIENMEGKTFHHHVHILHDIRTMMGESPKVFLEIGSYCGASASLMLKHHFPTKVYCVDPLNLPPRHYSGTKPQSEVLHANLSSFKGENSFEVFQAYSNDPSILRDLKERGINIDIRFIDGNHSYGGVLNDFKNYHQFVSPGGFIVFDDYLDSFCSPEVKLAVDKIVQDIENESMPYEVIGVLDNHQNAFFGLGIESDQLNEFILKKV